MFGDGNVDLVDDFSLSSSIDEINYNDDPFDSNHNNTTGIGTGIGISPVRRVDSLISQGGASDARNHDTWNVRNRPLSGNTNFSEHNPSLFETGGAPLNAKEMITSKKKQPSYSIQKQEMVAVKARKTSAKNLLIQSKSDGILSLALKAKYRTPAAEQLRNNTITSSSSGYSVNEMGGNDIPASGKLNASWNITPGSQTNATFVGGLDSRRYSLPTPKSSSMQDLLRQSKAQSRSKYLLRQSSASSLSKRNSFQSMKYVNEKLDVSSLLPARQYAKSTISSRRRSLPNVAASTAAFAKNAMSGYKVSTPTPTNDGTGDMTESLLHEACRLFPNSDTVVETALRVDPDAVRRSVVFTGDQDGEKSHMTKNSSTYGFPINLALTHGACEKILKMLVQSGSDVLTLKDGTNCSASLGIALSSHTCSLATIDLLLLANKKCAQIADRRGNYPLHIAVSYGRSVDIVMRLYAAYPEAQGMRNFHSLTPLDIAIQSIRCPEEVMDFLRSGACRTSGADETMNIKKPDVNQSFGSLEDGLDDIYGINY